MYYARRGPAAPATRRPPSRWTARSLTALGELARQHGLWLAAGLYERTDGLPYNTAVHAGRRRRAARLAPQATSCTTPSASRESDECRAGGAPFCPHRRRPAGRLGVITCYELRFPALAAAQRDGGRGHPVRPRGLGSRAKTSCCTGAPCCAPARSRTA